MFHKIVEAYAEQGFRLDLGNPSRLYATLVEERTGRVLSTGGGLSVSDALLFTAIARAMPARDVLVIGNAFGLSTFVLAESFPGARVDAIDAEAEGADNALGSALTRNIAAARYPSVQLTRGFSPQDLGKATRSRRYQFCFVDGLHTCEQMLADFNGVRPFMDDAAVIVFHDVALCRMVDAWGEVKRLGALEGYKGYPVGFTQFGVCVLARGSPAVEGYLSAVASEFDGHRYHLGIAPGSGRRSRVWTASPYEWELFLKRQLVELLRRLRGA